MMQYLLLLDWDLKYIFTFGAQFGRFMPTASCVGCHPWDMPCCVPEDAEQTRAFMEYAFKERRRVFWAAEWTSPSDHRQRHLYLCTAHWIGQPGVAMAVCGAEMPVGISSLSHREREILMALGLGQGTAHAVQSVGISESTFRTHLSRIREKLGLECIDEVVALGSFVIASHYGVRPDRLVTEGIVDLPPIFPVWCDRCDCDGPCTHDH